MDQEGNHDKVYGEDRTKGISLTFPYRITCTINENICVADILNNQYGRVVMLGKDDMINTYSGHPVINTEDKPFTPTGLTTTPADNAIVADAENYALHILNSSGNLITYISTKDKGILQNPYSIGHTMAGHFFMLYLGTSCQLGSIDNGKLYKLNLTGC
ncbi:Hypothetical predicted protein [Mytilus galloprovincialis]|uniref:Uncharacterized protein n=1 Tax=Mytilus galloprovincialis TaxID=29158 RepID=A0A8B6CRK0_MYTGA|nr:Hypothetical predicted protein [Mytilus galloprovincialis]